MFFTSRHGTPKYFLLTTFVSSVNEVTNDGIIDDEKELAEVVAAVVIVGDGDLVSVVDGDKVDVVVVIM